MRPMYRHSIRRDSGFTFVEMVIIAPLVILIISTIIVMAVALTGSAMRSTARANTQNDVLATLDRIEQDVKLSVRVNSISNTRIELTGLATDRNPFSTNRRLIRQSDCAVAVAGTPVSGALKYKVTYEIVGDSLRRTVTLPACRGSANVWQKDGMVEQMFTTSSTLRLMPQGATSLSSGIVEIGLSSERQVAGEKVDYTGYLYVKSLNAL